MLEYLCPSTIHPPFANYSHGVVVPPDARIVFCSGQLGIDAEGEVPTTVEGQARLCFENISAVLEEAGGNLQNAIRINAFVTDRSYLKAYMSVRDTFFPEKPAPASTLMIVSGFAIECFKVEIELVAALPAASPQA